MGSNYIFDEKIRYISLAFKNAVQFPADLCGHQPWQKADIQHLLVNHTVNKYKACSDFSGYLEFSGYDILICRHRKFLLNRL